MLGVPGRYLREPNAETRRALVRIMSNGYLGMYEHEPDTLALILLNMARFAPLFVTAQAPPHFPDAELQAWIRVLAPRRRTEMVRALGGWLVPGRDSVSAYHGMLEDLSDPEIRWMTVARARAAAAQRLADWDARELLAPMRAMRTRMGTEARKWGAARGLEPLEQVDDAIRRLEGMPGGAPLAPDGRGGFRSRYGTEGPLGVRGIGSAAPNGAWPSTMDFRAHSLWGMVVASRESVLVRDVQEGIEFVFRGGATAQLTLGRQWGELVLHQEMYPTVHLVNPELYVRVLRVTGEPPPQAVVEAARSSARFQTEHVTLAIDRDSVRVRGNYVFVSDSAARPFAIRFPAVNRPGQPHLRDWWVRLEGPRSDAMILPRQRARPDSGFIVFPGEPDAVVHVIAETGELLHGGRSVTYLLTTARAWGEPIHRAVLEVDWPDSLGVPEFSLPLVRTQQVHGRSLFRFEAAPFRPEQDLVVSW